jgi:hypothetical protein
MGSIDPSFDGNQTGASHGAFDFVFSLGEKFFAVGEDKYLFMGEFCEVGEYDGFARACREANEHAPNASFAGTDDGGDGLILVGAKEGRASHDKKPRGNQVLP